MFEQRQKEEERDKDCDDKDAPFDKLVLIVFAYKTIESEKDRVIGRGGWHRNGRGGDFVCAQVHFFVVAQAKKTIISRRFTL